MSDLYRKAISNSLLPATKAKSNANKAGSSPDEKPWDKHRYTVKIETDCPTSNKCVIPRDPHCPSVSFRLGLVFHDIYSPLGSKAPYINLPLRRISVFVTPVPAENRHCAISARPYTEIVDGCPSWGLFDGAFDRGGLCPVEQREPCVAFPSRSLNYVGGPICHGWSIPPPEHGVMPRWICHFEVDIPTAMFHGQDYTQFLIEACIEFGYLKPLPHMPSYPIRADSVRVELKLT